MTRHIRPLIAAAATIAAGLIATAGPASAAQSGWSGYSARGGPYTSVTGTFVTPVASPSCSGVVTMQVDAGALRAGVTEHCRTATTWVAVPSSKQARPLPGVKPGNEIRVTFAHSSHSTWTVELTDLTTNARYTRTVQWSGRISSAEWVAGPRQPGPSVCVQRSNTRSTCLPPAYTPVEWMSFGASPGKLDWARVGA